MLEKTAMAESRLGGAYWFCAKNNGVNCRNVTKLTFKNLLGLGTTAYERLN